MNPLAEISLSTLLMRLGAVLVLVTLAGIAVSAVARRLGEPGPARDGGMSLGPAAHLDATGLVAALVFGAGWGKSPDAAPGRMGGVPGALVLVLVSTLALLALAIIATLLQPLAARALSDSATPIAGGFLRVFRALAVKSALLNLVPLPPLTAGLVLAALWPAGHAALRRHLLPLGIALLFFLATGLPQRVIDPAAAEVIRQMEALR